MEGEAKPADTFEERLRPDIADRLYRRLCEMTTVDPSQGYRALHALLSKKPELDGVTLQEVQTALRHLRAELIPASTPVDAETTHLAREGLLQRAYKRHSLVELPDQQGESLGDRARRAHLGGCIAMSWTTPAELIDLLRPLACPTRDDEQFAGEISELFEMVAGADRENWLSLSLIIETALADRTTDLGLLQAVWQGYFDVLLGSPAPSIERRVAALEWAATGLFHGSETWPTGLESILRSGAARAIDSGRPLVDGDPWMFYHRADGLLPKEDLLDVLVKRRSLWATAIVAGLRPMGSTAVSCSIPAAAIRMHQLPIDRHLDASPTS